MESLLASHADRHSVIATQPDGNERPGQWLAPAVAALTLAAVGWTIAYLAAAVPGAWLSNAPVQLFSGAQMTITHGSGFSDGTNFIITATDPTGLAIVTIDTPTVHANDYRRIRWKVTAVDPEVTLTALWRSGAAPGRINSAPLVPYGNDVVLALPQAPDWSGRIEGIALTVNGTLRQPIFIQEARIEPIDVRSVVSDRRRDWFHFVPWSGLSINTAIGGPLEQPVWLTGAAAAVVLTAVGLCFAWGRRRLSATALSLAVAAIIATGWLALDVRWLWSRLQQTQATAATYSGKSLREKHLSDIDGYVYAFAEQVLLRLPSTPSRVFVGADDHYFGGRLAYQLYPHNAYMNHDTGALPPVERCKPGDFVVIFRRKGVVYDPVNRMLSWDEQRAVPADVLIAHQGNAAFRLR